MIYWRRYVGDFMRDTAHLSLAEVGAYDRLLDVQYSTEQPLPVAPESLCRICRAHSPEECAAVQSVADQFFPVADDGRWNPRARRELDATVPTIEKRRKNGAAAARVRWGTDAALDRALDTGPDATLHATFDATLDHNHIHNHIHNQNQNQGSGKSIGKETLSGTLPDVAPLPKKNDHAKAAREILEFLNAKTGRRYQPVKANLDLIIARLRDGATPDEMRMVVAKKCREWKGNIEMEIYLRPATLFARTKFAQYQGEINADNR